MTDQWVPGPPPQPPQWVNPVPPANNWNDAEACAIDPSQPSIVDGIVITGVPATVSSLYWQVSLNDGGAPPNFQINKLDGQGNFVSTSMEASGVDGSMTVAEGPTQPLGVATKAYVDAAPPGEAPMDSYPYARYMGTWERLPQSYIPEAPNTSQVFGRFNSTWQLIAIQTDAPNDGAAYGRVSQAWATVIPTTGGTITGSLTVNQVLTVQGSNSLVLNAPVTGGSQRTILGMAANIARWGLALGDGTAEGTGNVGANFTLSAYGTTGAFLGNWLTIARADGATIFNGSGVTVQGGLAVNSLLALQGPGMFYLPGGTPGQMLSTNGDGLLSWATPPGASGGIPEAPNDGTTYARNSAAWVHLTHADITDWAAQLAPYALTANVPVASSTPPLMDGTAAVGTGTTWARADHVHPTDTSRYAASNPSGYQTVAQVTASLAPYAPLASPALTGVPTAPTAAPGTNTTQIATTAFVEAAASGGNFLPLTGGTLSGALNVNLPTSAVAIGINGGNAAWLQLNAGNSGAGRTNLITGQVAGSYRWQENLGDGTAESGGNTGSNFSIQSFSDSGAALGTPLAINRATGQVTIPNLSAPGVIGSNRIINGDMLISQRNGNTTVTPTGGVYTADRWLYGMTVASKFSIVRAGPNPTTAALGFPYFLQATSQSAYTPVAADAFNLQQRIEGDMVADFLWGTANAQPATLSFWANALAAGTYSGAITNTPNPPATRSYPFTFTLAAAGLQKIVVPIPGDTAGTWTLNGNGAGINVIFDLGCGATYRGPAGAWASANYGGATGAIAIVATNGGVLAVTGVKLEIGNVATPFNRQSLTKSLADCQRYYQLGFLLMGSYNVAGGGVQNIVNLPVCMRATPTLAVTVNNNINLSGFTLSSTVPYAVWNGGTTATATGPAVINCSFSATAEL